MSDIPRPEDLLAQAEGILTRAESESRDLDDAERQVYDDLLRRAERAAKVQRIRDGLADGSVRVSAGTGFPAAEAAVNDQHREQSMHWHDRDRIAAKATGKADARRAAVYAPGAGEDLTRIDTPAGLAQRSRDAIEQADLSDASREMLTAILDREDRDPRASALVMAGLSPAYVRAFAAHLRDPRMGHLAWTGEEREAWARVQHARAAMAVGSEGAGGALLPYTLDSQVLLVSNSALNPIRGLARVVTTATDTWNGVTSAGVTSAWKAEAAETTETSPTFTKVTITPERLTAVIEASHEVAADTDIVSQLPRLLADSFDEAEGTGFMTGAGHSSNQPVGLITAVAAVTASRVAATTTGAFSAATDLYRLDNELPDRARTGRVAWFANRTVWNTVRSFADDGGSDLWAQLGDGTPPRLLGYETYASTAMTSAVTTGSNLVCIGDVLGGYTIAQRLGTVVFADPMVRGGSGGPTAEWQYLAYRRVSGGVMDVNRFRLLRL